MPAGANFRTEKNMAKKAKSSKKPAKAGSGKGAMK